MELESYFVKRNEYVVRILRDMYLAHAVPRRVLREPSISLALSSRSCSCRFLANFPRNTSLLICSAGKVDASYCKDSAQLIIACLSFCNRL